MRSGLSACFRPDGPVMARWPEMAQWPEMARRQGAVGGMGSSSTCRCAGPRGQKPQGGLLANHPQTWGAV